MFYIKSLSRDEVNFWEAEDVKVVKFDYLQEPDCLEIYKELKYDFAVEQKFHDDLMVGSKILQKEEIEIQFSTINFEKVMSGEIGINGNIEIVVFTDKNDVRCAFVPDCSCYITNEKGATLYNIKNYISICKNSKENNFINIDKI